MTKVITYSSDINQLNAALSPSAPLPSSYFFNFGPYTPTNPGILPPDTNYSHSSYPLTNTAFLNAIKMWENYVDVDFQSGTSANQINFTYWNTFTGSSSRGGGTTYSTIRNFNTATKFEIFINQSPNQLGVSNNNPSYENWGNWVIAHEIGHTLLGSGHPSDSNPALYGDLRTSIMINPVQANGNPIPSISPSIKIPLTPGMQDIATLQAPTKLGPSTTSSLNDTYTFTNTSINFTASTATATKGGPLSVTGAPSNYVMTIWDSGGIDTINATGVTTNTYINLNAGQFSSIGSNKNIAPTGLIGSTTYGTEYNVGIANGADIEYARGGTANDVLIGNALPNALYGGNGSDTLTGGLGADAFIFDVFNAGNIDNDTVIDFNRAQGDKINLSLIDSNVYAVDDQAFKFIGTAAFSPISAAVTYQGIVLIPASNSVSELRVETSSSGLVLQGDINNDRIADFHINLTGVTSMLATDFVL
jgi:serralysin